MNDIFYPDDYSSLHTPPPLPDLGADVDDYVRENPGGSVLIALGIGLAVGVLVRGLRPEPTPQHRLGDFLADLQDRIRENSAPALRAAASLASESAHLLGDGLHRGEAQFDHFFRRAARRLRGFWA